MNAAIGGLGGWGRQLVDSVLEDGRPKSECIRFTRAHPLIDIERAELEAVAEAASRGDPCPVTQEAVHGIALFEAMTKSAEGDGEPVEVA